MVFDMLKNRNVGIHVAILEIMGQRDINLSDENGMTMLHCSCSRKDGLPLVELLLYLGIDKEKEDRWKMKASFYA